MKKIVIEATRITGGGGKTQLLRFLEESISINTKDAFKLIVWASPQILGEIPNHPRVEKNTPHRFFYRFNLLFLWQLLVLPVLLRLGNYHAIFLPTSSFVITQIPTIALHQNMLPFSPHHLKRYGLSLMSLRLATLRIQYTLAYLMSDGIVFSTNHSKDTVLSSVTTGADVAVIPHGADLIIRNLDLNITTSTPSNLPFRLVYLSAIDVYKNHETLILGAFLFCKEAGIPLQLDFIGSEYKPCSRKIRDLLQKYKHPALTVRLLGQITHSKVLCLLPTYNAGIWASTCETFGIGLLEQMSANLPHLVAEYASTMEIVPSNTLTFQSHNPYSIKNGLFKLVTNTTYQSTNGSACGDQANKYTWDQHSKSLLSFILKHAI